MSKRAFTLGALAISALSTPVSAITLRPRRNPVPDASSSESSSSSSSGSSETADEENAAAGAAAKPQAEAAPKAKTQKKAPLLHKKNDPIRAESTSSPAPTRSTGDDTAGQQHIESTTEELQPAAGKEEGAAEIPQHITIVDMQGGKLLLDMPAKVGHVIQKNFKEEQGRTVLLYEVGDEEKLSDSTELRPGQTYFAVDDVRPRRVLMAQQVAMEPMCSEISPDQYQNFPNRLRRQHAAAALHNAHEELVHLWCSENVNSSDGSEDDWAWGVCVDIVTKFLDAEENTGIPVSELSLTFRVGARVRGKDDSRSSDKTGVIVGKEGTYRWKVRWDKCAVKSGRPGVGHAWEELAQTVDSSCNEDELMLWMQQQESEYEDVEVDIQGGEGISWDMRTARTPGIGERGASAFLMPEQLWSVPADLRLQKKGDGTGMLVEECKKNRFYSEDQNAFKVGEMINGEIRIMETDRAGKGVLARQVGRDNAYVRNGEPAVKFRLDDDFAQIKRKLEAIGLGNLVSSEGDELLDFGRDADDRCVMKMNDSGDEDEQCYHVDFATDVEFPAALRKAVGKSLRSVKSMKNNEVVAGLEGPQNVSHYTFGTAMKGKYTFAFRTSFAELKWRRDRKAAVGSLYGQQPKNAFEDLLAEKTFVSVNSPIKTRIFKTPADKEEIIEFLRGLLRDAMREKEEARKEGHRVSWAKDVARWQKCLADALQAKATSEDEPCNPADHQDSQNPTGIRRGVCAHCGLAVWSTQKRTKELKRGVVEINGGRGNKAADFLYWHGAEDEGCYAAHKGVQDGQNPTGTRRGVCEVCRSGVWSTQKRTKELKRGVVEIDGGRGNKAADFLYYHGTEGEGCYAAKCRHAE